MRRLLLLAAALAWAPIAPAQTASAPAPIAASVAIAPQTVDLQVSPNRSTTLTIWAPEVPRGVVLFSTGFGSWPERYQAVVDAMTSEGFVVLAPLHVDSMHYPDRDKFDRQQIFFERFADMRATSAYAQDHFTGLPVIAAGHSFGSLVSLAEGGALANLMPLRNDAVRAVLAFSTSGRIPGLITDSSYATIAVPVMEVTGTEDRIPEGFGIPGEPADHLLPVQTSGATAYGIVLQGGEHSLVGQPDVIARALPAIRLFLRGYGLDDADARAALHAWQADDGDQFIVHEKAQ